MTTTHDYHRLSLCGFKGLDRIARDRRRQRNMERLGFWLTVFFLIGRSQGWRLTPSEVAQALRSAAASGSYIAEPIRIRANETLSHV